MVWVSVYFTTDLIQTGVDLRRTIFRMKVSFDFFFKFFGAFFKTSKRGSIGIPYHNTVQRNRSWNEILDGFPQFQTIPSVDPSTFFLGFLTIG